MIERFQTTAADQGERLDRFLARNSQTLSRTVIRAVIDLGGVHVDGRRARKSGMFLAANQHIELHRDNGPLDPYRIEPARVLFQDDHLIVIDKPAGVDTQPTLARYRGTLYEALQVWLERDRRFGRKLEIGMAQRLDRETSGVIVFSIHPRAHASLTAQIGSHQAKKIYLALVQGRPQPLAGVYRSNLLKDRRSGLIKSVARGGREAVTGYRVVATTEAFPEVSLVELELVTGRTHQIRAHLAEAGHPLLGDVRYGGPADWGGRRFARHCLHSHRLELRHPVTGEPLRFSARMPDDMVIDGLQPGP